MKQVMILVEGQTEETFINKVLQPYLIEKEIFLSATMVCTKQVKSVRRHRGGGNNYDFIKRDISNLLKSSHFDLVTTLIDYYALPENFPGQDTLPTTSDGYAKVAHLETEFGQDISNTKFYPFIMLHEFETMIFCDIYSLSDFFSDKMASLHTLNSVLTHFENPELINNSPETAPSKRILVQLEGYKKTLHGPIAITNIGIDKIRQLCPHFNDWLTHIESL
ncbi:DUF4276 family protein [Bacillus infantis]|uniref:DUF4276 family protein n=1 Tax=Bacillus infantis TaxID=324767 RepID=UPI00209EA684|nr:DUF4276 family protein [Bacillus infantis]MCP1157003.1 DUF4276 family protein [Bacillus infantis]